MKIKETMIATVLWGMILSGAIVGGVFSIRSPRHIVGWIALLALSPIVLIKIVTETLRS